MSWPCSDAPISNFVGPIQYSPRRYATVAFYRRAILPTSSDESALAAKHLSSRWVDVCRSLPSRRGRMRSRIWVTLGIPVLIRCVKDLVAHLHMWTQLLQLWV